jgi:hypothetical protein
MKTILVRYNPITNQWTELPNMPLPTTVANHPGAGITHMGNAMWVSGREIILVGGLGIGFTNNNYWPGGASARPEAYA